MAPWESAKGKTSGPGRQVALAKEGAMQPTKISHMVRVMVISAALLSVSGVGVPRAGVMAAQQAPGTTTTIPSGVPTGLPPLDPSGTEPDGELRVRLEHQREKAVNDDRHKRLAADVDRLVELSNELKTEVDKTNKDELSVEVIKKAQEIEKLAHDVQSRMKS